MIQDTTHSNGDARTRVRGYHIGLVVMALLGSVLGVAAVASAQSGPTSNCSGATVTTFGSSFFGTESLGNRLLSTSPSVRTFTLAAPLPAGTYEVDAVSYDGYPNREVIPAQPREVWFGELLAADGSVLATTAPTADLADLVVEATWSGSLGTVTTTDTATSIRVSHAFPGDPNINSVRPVCLGATAVATEIPPNEVKVTYTNQGEGSGTVGVICTDQSESASGRLVQIRIGDIPAGTDCTVTYPTGGDCEIAVSPTDTSIARIDGGIEILTPAEGGVSIMVDIVCDGLGDDVDTDVDGDTETDDADDADDGDAGGSGGSGAGKDGTDDSSTGVEAEVKGTTETATPTAAQPSFTG